MPDVPQVSAERMGIILVYIDVRVDGEIPLCLRGIVTQAIRQETAASSKRFPGHNEHWSGQGHRDRRGACATCVSNYPSVDLRKSLTTDGTVSWQVGVKAACPWGRACLRRLKQMTRRARHTSHRNAQPPR